jgi:long-chain fatty acid transport protein
MKTRKFAARLWVAAAAFAVAMSVAPNAWALNYQQYPIGEHAAGLGGAYIAISDDASGCYYNPAGLAFATNSSLSLSGTVYGFTSARLTNAVTIGNAAGSLNVDTYYAIPSLFGTVYRFGSLSFDDKGPKDNVVALSIVVPDYFDYRNQTKYTGGGTLFTSQYQNQTYWFGPSYARRLSEHFGVGATLYGMFGQEMFNSNFTGSFGPQNFPVLTSKLDIASNTTTDIKTLNLLLEVGGAMVYGDFRLGLVFRSPSLQAWGQGSEADSGLAAYNGQASVTKDQTNYRPIRHDSLMAGLGFAWARPLHYTASVDVKYFGPDNYQDASVASVASHVKVNQIANLNVGGEYVIRETVPLQAGFYTNFSPYANAKIDTYGATFCTGLIHLQSTTTLGVNYGWGAGKVSITKLAQRGQTITSVAGTGNVTIETANVLLSTAYRF